MGYSYKYDPTKYSDEDIKIINNMISTMELNKDIILVESKNIYYFKTGCKIGNYPKLTKYMEENNKKIFRDGKIRLEEGKGSPGGKYRGSGGYGIEWKKYDELNNQTLLRDMIKDKLPSDRNE